MKEWRVLLVLLLCSGVYCDCVTFDFERDFNISFSNEDGVCTGRDMWNVGMYENQHIESPHVKSTKFIYPNDKLTCASSFTFSMSPGGLLEVNVFMKPMSSMDQLTVLAMKKVQGGNDAVAGNAWVIATDNNFESGWRTITMTLTGTETFPGYITLMAMASRNSLLLVDSFRYVAPSFDKDLCVIYGLPTESTTTSTELSTTRTTTEIPTTTSTATTETPTTTMITTAETPPTTKISTTSTTTTTEIPNTTTSITTTTTSATTKIPTASTTSEISDATTMTTGVPITTTTTTSTTDIQSCATEATSSTTTERPRLSVSIMLIKINKFFR